MGLLLSCTKKDGPKTSGSYLLRRKKHDFNNLIPKYYDNNKKVVKFINTKYPILAKILENNTLRLRKSEMNNMSPRSRDNASFHINFKTMQFYVPNSNYYKSGFSIQNVGKDKMTLSGRFDLDYWKCKIKFNINIAIVKIYIIEHKTEYTIEL